MKSIVVSLLGLIAPAIVVAQLPPVFSAESSATYQQDSRVRTYLPPTRVVWTQHSDLISGEEFLLRSGCGQSSTMARDLCIMRSEAGKYPSILLDFGREIQGGLQIVTGFINPQGPVKLRIRFGESVSEAMSDVSVSTGATNDHAMRDFVHEVPWLGVSEVGNSGFRFVRIDLLDDDVRLPIREIRAVFTYRDLPYLGSFHSSNSRLDSIWMTGAYTVHLNMQEYLWDGIKRDRLVWLGDMHPELKSINAVFGDNEVLRRSLDLARDETPLPGWINRMCSYSLWWVLCHRDYYMYHGDKAYLKEQHEYMAQLLRILMGLVDEQGREQLPASGRFLDWPTSQDKESVDAGLQALMLMTLRAGSEMAAVMGDASLATECRTVAERMTQYKPSYTSSKQSAALLALAGQVTPDEANAVLREGGVERFSTFYGYYMLQAKALAGDYADAMSNISTYWGGMLDLGATTFWEDFDLAWSHNAGRIDELVPADKVDVHLTYGDYCYKGMRHSLCHGWASGPTAWLSEHVLGVTIVEAGCKVVRVRPNLGDLTWVEGSFPTPHGVIYVRHEKRADGSVKSDIRAPKGVKIIHK